MGINYNVETTALLNRLEQAGDVKLSDNHNMLLREFHDKLLHEHSPQLAQIYKNGYMGFLLFMSEKNINPAELTIDYLLEYSLRLRISQQTMDTKRKYVSGVNRLLKHFYEQGFIPRCYLTVVSSSEYKTDANTLRLTTDGYPGNAFQPSKAIEHKAESFLLRLEGQHYSKGTRQILGYMLGEFFRFLEINHIEYSPDASRLWLTHVPSDQAMKNRHWVIARFDDYMLTGDSNKSKKIRRKPLLIDSLPDWSRRITDSYLLLRQREGWAEKTIVMSRSSCVRFFRFLDRKSVTEAGEITYALVKEFHDTEPHATPRSRNMYSTGVRKLLIYMAELKLIAPSLHFAVSTQYSPCREIVSVMSPEMESAIFDYRSKAESPSELRNAAIVMIGLRMGLRASDIANLKIDDFDWAHRKLSIIQSKSKKAISLHIPTDAGNSIYRYISQGRPQTGSLGAGYVFIAHRAPFSNLSSPMCYKALKSILHGYGLKLKPGQGFHITRKTFATRLLTAGTAVDTIADSLGHAARDAVDNY